ncbi:MAG: hypothetical protein ACYSSI_02670 [Planctomycetota bacterium]|jgi:hypothetical protein
MLTCEQKKKEQSLTKVIILLTPVLLLFSYGIANYATEIHAMEEKYGKPNSTYDNTISHPKTSFYCARLQSPWTALSAKKVLDVQGARLRAFSTSSLVHELFAQARHKPGFGMTSSLFDPFALCSYGKLVLVTKSDVIDESAPMKLVTFEDKVYFRQRIYIPYRPSIRSPFCPPHFFEGKHKSYCRNSKNNREGLCF